VDHLTKQVAAGRPWQRDFCAGGCSLTINGSQTFSGSAVTAGTGANNGAAAHDLFLMSGTTTVLAPARATH